MGCGRKPKNRLKDEPCYAKVYYDSNNERIKENANKWNKKHPETVRKKSENYRKRNMYKIKVQRKLEWAVEKGIIKKSKNCQVCKNKCKVGGHHPDYSKPLEVVWVCQQCHSDIHYKGWDHQ